MNPIAIVILAKSSKNDFYIVFACDDLCLPVPEVEPVWIFDDRYQYRSQ
jgi:hypothetical protein